MVLRPPPHVSGYFFNPLIFLCGYGFRPHGVALPVNPGIRIGVLRSAFRIQITLTRFVDRLFGWVLSRTITLGIVHHFSQIFVSHLLQILLVWDCNYSQFNKHKDLKRKMKTTYLLKRKKKTKKKTKKKESHNSFQTLVLIVNSARNIASWLAKIGDTILALVGSQVIVPALWLAQTKVCRESTPYITLLHFCSTNENFSTYSNTSRSTIMLPPCTPCWLDRWQ